MSGLLNKVKEMVTGHAKGDDGSGVPPTDDTFDEAAYRKEKYGSEDAGGTAPYKLGSGGEMLDREDGGGPEAPAAAYRLGSSADTSEQSAGGAISTDREELGSSAVGTTSGTGYDGSAVSSAQTTTGNGGLASEYDSSATTGTGASGLGSSGITSGQGYDGSAVSSTGTSGLASQYDTTTSSTSGYGGTGIQTSGSVGEILPGPSGITGAINENQAGYGTVLEEVKEHGLSDHGL